jgi:hypothetical protein
MKLSSYILTAMSLVTSVLAAPVLVEKSADIAVRCSNICCLEKSFWYVHRNVLPKDLSFGNGTGTWLMRRNPLTLLRSRWDVPAYAVVKLVSKAHTQKRSTKKRSPQGSFIWEWYGDVADEKESTDSTEIEVRCSNLWCGQTSFWYMPPETLYAETLPARIFHLGMVWRRSWCKGVNWYYWGRAHWLRFKVGHLPSGYCTWRILLSLYFWTPINVIS